MRPSQYHYIKRMWTRNLNKKHVTKKRKHGKKKSYVSYNSFEFENEHPRIAGFLYIFLGTIIFFMSLLLLLASMSGLIFALIGIIFIIYGRALLKKGRQDKSSGVQSRNNYCAQEKLKRINELSGIINTTASREEFEKALSEIKTELRDLSAFKDGVKFLNSTPEEELNKIIENEPAIRKNFRERVKNSSKTQEITQEDNAFIDVERYAVMCNAYLEHMDEMSQYESEKR